MYINCINDVGIKLNSAEIGIADITIKKIEEGAAKIVEEEEAARGVEEEGVTPGVVAAVGLTWLWWLIGIVVVIALGYYFFVKKK